MKNIFIFIHIFLIANSLFAQQSKINGEVTIFRSKFETGQTIYVANAVIKHIAEKSSANQQLTDNNGQFRLIFNGLKSGETAYLWAEKDEDDLVIVNTDNLRAVTDQKEKIKIWMCSRRKLARAQIEFQDNAASAAYSTLENKIKEKNIAIKELKKSQNIDQSKISSLEQELEDLNTKYDQVYKLSAELSEKYSRINLDDMSSLYTKAYSYFELGELDSALNLLNQNHLEQRTQTLFSAQQRTKNLRSELALQDSINNIVKNDLIIDYKLKLDLHKIKYEWDSVEFCYNKLLLIDSLDEKILFEYAGFLEESHNYKKAVYYLERALKNCTSFSKKIVYEILLDSYKNELKKSDRIHSLADFEIALDSVKKYQNINYNLCKSSVLMFLAVERIGKAFDFENFSKKSLLQAEQYFKEANLLTESDTITTEYDRLIIKETINLGLGGVYSALWLKSFMIKTGYRNQAFKKYTESIDICKYLIGKDSTNYELKFKLGAALESQLLLYPLDKKRRLEIRKEVFVIEKDLTAINFKRYAPHLAGSYRDLGDLYRLAKNYPLAEINFIESFNIREKFFHQSISQRELYYLLLESINLFYEEWVESEKSEKDKLNIQKRYCMLYDRVCQNGTNKKITEHYSNIMGSLSWLYLFDKKFEDAELTARKALEIDPKQTWINTNLALSLLLQQKPSKELEAEKIYRALANENYNDGSKNKFREVFLEDIHELVTKNVATAEDVEKIKAWIR